MSCTPRQRASFRHLRRARREIKEAEGKHPYRRAAVILAERPIAPMYARERDDHLTVQIELAHIFIYNAASALHHDLSSSDAAASS